MNAAVECPTVALIDAGGANLGSVRYALERLGIFAIVTSDPAVVASADRVILPGVGAARPAMQKLAAAGLVDALRSLQAPLLGICLGMQLLYEWSEEGEVECLGLLPGRVARLQPAPGLRVPHMGWNRLRITASDPMMAGIAQGAHAYFVHGFAAPVTADTIACCDHGIEFTSVARRGRYAGAQFHPERSAMVGARLLENFVRGDQS